MSKKSSQIFLVILAYIVFVCLGCRELPILKDKLNNFDTETVEKEIRENPDFQELNKICEQIAIPEGSKLIGKTRNPQSIGFSTYYDSQASFDNLEKFFEENLKNN